MQMPSLMLPKSRWNLMLANQRTIMVNQTELQAHQQALERRMDKMENLILQILKALQKGKGNQ